MSSLRIILTLVIVFGVSALNYGCRPKAKPEPIESLKLVKDEISSFEMKVPSNWFIQHRQGDYVIAFSSESVKSRFTDFKAGLGGAKVEIRAIPLQDSITIDTVLKRAKVEFVDGLDRYTKKVSQLAGTPGQKLFVEFDQEDGKYVTESYFAEVDSVVTVVTFSAFGNTFKDYQKEFAEILASVKLARKKSTAALATVDLPSEKLVDYADPQFSIKHPDNFIPAKGNPALALYTTKLKGTRGDFSIVVDIMTEAKGPASLNDVRGKQIANYRGDYKGVQTNNVNLGGLPGFVVSYDASDAVRSRAYFAVKGNKVFRVTISWNVANEAKYLPLFESCIQSMKIN